MITYSRAMENCKNEAQGINRRVLCLCTAGLLRSPTAAWVLSQAPYNYNTRAAGVNPSYALIPVSDVLIHWADEIVVVHKTVALGLTEFVNEHNINLEGKSLILLDIPDAFSYRNSKLIKMIRTQYDEISSVR